MRKIRSEMVTPISNRVNANTKLPNSGHRGIKKKPPDNIRILMHPRLNPVVEMMPTAQTPKIIKTANAHISSFNGNDTF